MLEEYRVKVEVGLIGIQVCLVRFVPSGGLGSYTDCTLIAVCG